MNRSINRDTQRCFGVDMHTKLIGVLGCTDYAGIVEILAIVTQEFTDHAC